MSHPNSRSQASGPPHPPENASFAASDSAADEANPPPRSAAVNETVLQFCPKAKYVHELQNQFVETVRSCLTRCGPAITAQNFIGALQEDFTPELFVHPEVVAKAYIYSALTDKFQALGILVPPFAAGEKKSRALRLARIVWNGPEYQHERAVAEFIVHNRVTPDPHHPITLTTPPPGTTPAFSPASNATQSVGFSAWRPPVVSHTPHSVAPQTPQEHAMQQALQRLHFEEDPPRPTTTATATAPPFSRLTRNTADFRNPNSAATHPPPISNPHSTAPPHLPIPPAHPAPSGYPGPHSHHHHNPSSSPHTPHNPWERHNKLAVAFSTAFKDASSRFSGNIDDSWPEKREMFEDVAQNYRCSKAEAFEFLNNLFTGGARTTFRRLIKGKTHDYDAAMAILEKEFHSAPVQARILAKLESLKFTDFTSSDSSPNDAFIKLSERIEELFPRSPPQMQNDYHKRRILCRAVAEQPWALATLDRTDDELPTYTALSSALASVLQKHVSRSSTSTPPDNGTFYANPRYGRYPKPRWTHAKSQSHPRPHHQPHHDRNRRYVPRRKFYRFRRHYQHSKGNQPTYLVSEDDLESIDLDETEEIQLATEELPEDTPITSENVDTPSLDATVSPPDPACPTHFVAELSNSANFHATIGTSDFSDEPF